MRARAPRDEVSIGQTSSGQHSPIVAIGYLEVMEPTLTMRPRVRLMRCLTKGGRTKRQFEARRRRPQLTGVRCSDDAQRVHVPHSLNMRKV